VAGFHASPFGVRPGQTIHSRDFCLWQEIFQEIGFSERRWARHRQNVIRFGVYASFNPAPRSPRNCMPLAVTMNAEPGWVALGAT
jgi:hypothetical protein